MSVHDGAQITFCSLHVKRGISNVCSPPDAVPPLCFDLEIPVVAN